MLTSHLMIREQSTEEPHRAHCPSRFYLLPSNASQHSASYPPVLHTHSSTEQLFSNPNSPAAHSAPTLTQPWGAGLSSPQDLGRNGKTFWQSSSPICLAIHPTDAIWKSGSGANREWKGKWERFLNWYFKVRLPLSLFLTANPSHQLPRVEEEQNG